MPVFDGLLSPIDLKSNRGMKSQLDKMFESYSKKEELFNESNKRKLDNSMKVESEIGDSDIENFVKETPLRKVNDFFK